jgi:hypothetical protein
MQPSTHVTHIPLMGHQSPPVLFFVRVAAVALYLVSVICCLLPLVLSSYLPVSESFLALVD